VRALEITLRNTQHREENRRKRFDITVKFDINCRGGRVDAESRE
jgi:hypothetical protein